MLHVLSLGAGVQSTCMALMAATGEIEPAPDLCLFADTGWEPEAVYDHLVFLRSPGMLPFPVEVVSDGNIRDDIMRATKGKRWLSIPAFAGTGMIRRQCTKEYKLVPLRRRQRQLAGIYRKRSPNAPVVTTWIGISTDEYARAKPAREAWQAHRFPLIEQEMSRSDCQDWMRDRGYPEAPKSACIGCPYRSDESWGTLPPGELEDAREVDDAIRVGVKNMVDEVFLHRSLTPLREIELKGPPGKRRRDLFVEECEGVCAL